MGLSYVGHFGRTLIDTGCSSLEVVLRQLLNNDQLVGLFVFYCKNICKLFGFFVIKNLFKICSKPGFVV